MTQGPLPQASSWPRISPVAVWGIAGVVLLLFNGVRRVLPIALEPLYDLKSLTWWHLAFYGLSVVFNTYMEGYRGFHLRVAPRVVSRAHQLSAKSRPIDVVLAPLYCSSFYGAPKRDLIARYILFFSIVGIIVAMHYVPQPWRGIVDAGVVVGLSIGCASIAWTYVRSLVDPDWFAGQLARSERR